jgi:hypothetical protein
VPLTDATLTSTNEEASNALDGNVDTVVQSEFTKTENIE